MREEQTLIEGVAESDHLIDHAIIMVGEGAGLREAGPVFLVRGYDALINHVDMAFVLFDQGEAEFQPLGEEDHLVHDGGRDRITVDDVAVDDRVGAIHRDQPIGLDQIKDPGFPDEVEVSSGAKENLDAFLLEIADRLDRRRRHLMALMGEKRPIDIRENDFDVLCFFFHLFFG